MDPASAGLNVTDFCALIRREAQLRLERARAARPPDAPCPAAASVEIRLGEEMTRSLERFVDGVTADDLLPDDVEDHGASLPQELAEAMIAASAAAPTAPARPLPTGAARRRAQVARARAGMLHRALLCNDLDMAIPALDALLPAGIESVPAEQRAALARAALRVLKEVELEAAERELGMHDLRPEDDPILAAMRPQPTDGAARPQPDAPKAEPLADEPPLSYPAPQPAEVRPPVSRSIAPGSRGTDLALAPDAMFSAVIEHAKSAERRASRHGKTVRDLDVAGRLLIALAGDRAMAKLSWADVAVFRDEALRLPRMHGRSIFAKLTPTKAIDLADALDDRSRDAVVAILGEHGADDALGSGPVERMSKKTINKHLSSLAGAARRWFNANRTENRQRNWTPFAGEFFPKSETKDDVRVVRAALTDGEIASLFASPRFTGHAGDRLRALPGPGLVRDGRYWAPLIGLHGGLRLEEILQLGPQDIDEVQGVTVFCVGRTAAANVKTLSARRLVPIHPLLIRLGLLDHAAEMRRTGQRQLFPELERGGPDQRFGYGFSKDFTEYRRAIGTYVPGRDFHALRHSLATALYNAGVDTSVVAAILGHAQIGVSAGVYLSGYKLAKLAEAIAALDSVS